MTKNKDELFTDWGLEQLNLTVPPGFEVALGYHDEAECISFFWEFGELYCDDGVNVYTANNDVWETWTRIPQVRRALEPFDLICPTTDADLCLVLFIEYRTFAVGPYDPTVKHLHGPHENFDKSYNPNQTRELQRVARKSFSNWLAEHQSSSPLTRSGSEPGKQARN